jgi:hypothetical protein
MPQAELAEKLPALLGEMQKNMFDGAKQRLRTNTVLANSIGEVESILNDVTAEKGGGKFVMAHVKDDPRCDLRVKEFKATIRCIPLVDECEGPGKCIVTGEQVDRRAVIAKGVLTTNDTAVGDFAPAYSRPTLLYEISEEVPVIRPGMRPIAAESVTGGPRSARGVVQ